MILHHELTIDDYLAIVRRRIWLLVLPAVICSVAAYAISRALPHRYVSETVVLVEGQAVPDNIVKAVGGDVNERLSTMQEEILSRTRLQQIIDKFGLYRDEPAQVTPEDRIARLRKAITVSPVRPMAETRANGLPGFTVEVVSTQPRLAQQICTEITSFFMEQNVLLRERRAEGTTDFLNGQLKEAKTKLDEQDAKLAEFQRRYMGELPDETQTNFSLLGGLASQLEATSQALSRAQQDKLFLEATLDQQLAAAKSPQTGQIESSPDLLQKQLESLQDKLADLQSRYTDQHPDVRKAKTEIARLEKKLQAENSTKPPIVAPEHTSEVAPVETTQIRQLRAQLHQVSDTIHDRSTEQAHLQQQIRDVQAKLQLSPQIAQEYKALTRDSQTALTIYNDLLKKHSDSEMATDLERQQQGEQFRVLDPPSLPQKPSFPNRVMFAFGGICGGLAIGVGLAAILEISDTTLHTERDVEATLTLPTLALISEMTIENSHDGIAKYLGFRRTAPPTVSTVN